MTNADSQQVMLLIEGVSVRAYLNDDQEAALCAKEIAILMLGKY